MPTESQLRAAARQADRAWHNHSESRVSVQRAVLNLRAIRQRYETGRNAYPDARGYRVHVVVDCGDMAWITAAIETLEETVVLGATETATPAQALVATE
jgi:hypothetical protein